MSNVSDLLQRALERYEGELQSLIKLNEEYRSQIEINAKIMVEKTTAIDEIKGVLKTLNTNTEEVSKDDTN